MATRKTRKFSLGGVTPDELETANASEDPIASLNAQKGWTGSEESPAKKESFKEAFARNRASGAKTFEWNGKKFTTDVAGAAPRAAAKVTDTGDETSRLAARSPAVAKKASYETPFDRARREDREQGRDIGSAVSRLKDRIMGASEGGQDRILRNTQPGKTNSKTMLPEYKKGGFVGSASRRADGIAQRGKTRGKMM